MPINFIDQAPDGFNQDFHNNRRALTKLEQRLKKADAHLQFMNQDARVTLARYQGFVQMSAAALMLVPGYGPFLRSGINWLMGDNSQEGFNFVRSFAPAFVKKLAPELAKETDYDSDEDNWLKFVFHHMFENSLNAPATVVGTDGLIYRVDGNFAGDYLKPDLQTLPIVANKIAGDSNPKVTFTFKLGDNSFKTIADASFSRKALKPSDDPTQSQQSQLESKSDQHLKSQYQTLINNVISELDDSQYASREAIEALSSEQQEQLKGNSPTLKNLIDGYSETIEVPLDGDSFSDFTAKLEQYDQSGNLHTKDFDWDTFIDAAELAVRNLYFIYDHISSNGSDNAKEALLPYISQKISDQLANNDNLAILERLRTTKTGQYYLSALAKIIQGVNFNTEYEGALQYRFGLYHQLDTSTSYGFTSLTAKAQADLRENLPKSSYDNLIASRNWATKYYRMLKTLDNSAKRKYHQNLLLPSEEVAANLLCYKSYCYSYGLESGGQIAGMLKGGLLSAIRNNQSPSHCGTKLLDILDRYGLSILKTAKGVYSFRSGNNDGAARTLFPLAMYISLLELRFGTHITPILTRKNQDEVQWLYNVRRAREQAERDNEIERCQQIIERLTAENARLQEPIQDIEDQANADRIQANRLEIENQDELIQAARDRFDEQDPHKQYDATLLGILDCLLSSAYFHYHTSGWDYSVTGKASELARGIWNNTLGRTSDKIKTENQGNNVRFFNDWQLFEDPLLIGYICRLKQLLGQDPDNENHYPKTLARHIHYFQAQVNNKNWDGAQWWAPTNISNFHLLGAGDTLMSAISRQGAWLSDSLEAMKKWLEKIADWDTITDQAADGAPQQIALEDVARNLIHSFDTPITIEDQDDIADAPEIADGHLDIRAVIKSMAKDLDISLTTGTSLETLFDELLTKKICQTGISAKQAGYILLSYYLNNGGDLHKTLDFQLKLAALTD
ncbi:hypothetical protein SG34_014120 [Thalassomonas viridans]|uniref:Uncharacterized protein n=1 Tax=Thalassomonas viridans TaxID=137584 RepID=A0AAF0C9V4_9GAMM|nr:hypothetical protein [Thalassomonas viridans]WDE07917.1 hypothetical protein SG34_014120 [Thalassomonas viridans]